jgi:hypothetical protein
LKWAARVVGAVIAVVVYTKWKEIAESYDLENGVMGTYRPVTLGLAYYLLWVFTRKIGGRPEQDKERNAPGPRGLSAPEIALFALFVCVAMAAGFFAAQFAYVETIDRTASVTVAKSLGFIAYLAAAGTVLGILNRVADFKPGPR